LAVVGVLFLTPDSPALESLGPAELAASYFEQLHGFSALEAYESRRGRARTSFGLARRWRDGRADILIDIQSPQSFAKWALLLRHNFGRSDDLFVYVPGWRLVRRLSALQLEAEVIYQLLPLGDLRPIVPGELEYTRLGDTQIEGERCVEIEGRPRHVGLPFDRVELALSTRSGLALRTRYFQGPREIRRILVSPQDIREYEGRSLPQRRRIIIPPDPGVTEILLRNVLMDPILPDRLFTHHNLRVQRFPRF
jgi:hypothetical protein